MKPEDLKIGQIITNEQHRDAIHVAIMPAIAGEPLLIGEHVGQQNDGTFVSDGVKKVGIVDPFLKKRVSKGEKFWLFIYPGTISSLYHYWEHPDIKNETIQQQNQSIPKLDSENWMRKWAIQHMSHDYYGDGHVSDGAAYERAIEAGFSMSVGPYESAKDYIDNEWWNHWETITGQKGSRGEYFSCGC